MAALRGTLESRKARDWQKNVSDSVRFGTAAEPVYLRAGSGAVVVM